MSYKGVLPLARPDAVCCLCVVLLHQPAQESQGKVSGHEEVICCPLATTRDSKEETDTSEFKELFLFYFFSSPTNSVSSS